MDDPFLVALKEFASGRVELDGLDAFNTFIRLNPGIAPGEPQRERFITTLNELVERSQLRLPVQRSGWDPSVRPPLPRWIRLIRERRSTPRFDHKTFAWSAELQWLANQEGITDPASWVKLNDFFRQGGTSRPMVPVKERSCQILGDEKRLERILKTRALVAAGMTAENFRCFHVTHVPVHRMFPDSPDAVVLISENEAGFDSHCRANHARPRFRTVVYGKGEEVLKSAEFLVRLMQEGNITGISYVGDVDPNGLSMPRRLNDRIAQLGGAVNVAPLRYAYEHLLKDVIPKADDRIDLPGPLASWLPEPLASKAQLLLTRNERRPQELVGWEFLTVHEAIPPN